MPYKHHKLPISSVPPITAVLDGKRFHHRGDDQQWGLADLAALSPTELVVTIDDVDISVEKCPGCDQLCPGCRFAN